MVICVTPDNETRHSGLDPESSDFLLDTGLRRYDDFKACFTLKNAVHLPQRHRDTEKTDAYDC